MRKHSEFKEILSQLFCSQVSHIIQTLSHSLWVLVFYKILQMSKKVPDQSWNRLLLACWRGWLGLEGHLLCRASCQKSSLYLSAMTLLQFGEYSCPISLNFLLFICSHWCPANWVPWSMTLSVSKWLNWPCRMSQIWPEVQKVKTFGANTS